MGADDWRVRPLAPDFVKVCESPDPDRIYCYSPGVEVLPGGRLIATTDWGGPDVRNLTGEKFGEGEHCWQGRLYTSDDGGDNWTLRTTFPFMHARPFAAGGSLYVLGHAGDLMVIRSDDGGETWSCPVRLTDGQNWHQAPANVLRAHGCVYLVMERRMGDDVRGWNVSDMAPVLMRGRRDTDLTRRDNWTFASELSFRDIMPGVEDNPEIDFFGVPFYSSPYPAGTEVAPGRQCYPMGWLEANVVQFHDPEHYWHDPTGRTFHLWMRAHTGRTGYACVAKVVERGDEPGTGPMETGIERVPSGKRALYVPCPGGHVKFHILYDEASGLYWLLSSQATDSMRRAECLPEDRHNLPCNERRRLQLHFSRNCMDWCFAGLVDAGSTEVASRHYGSMAVAGDDLLVLSRSGDKRALNPHDVNMVTFHRIPGFRRLIY